MSKFAKFMFLEYYLEFNNPSRATSIAYETFEKKNKTLSLRVNIKVWSQLFERWINCYPVYKAIAFPHTYFGTG